MSKAARETMSDKLRRLNVQPSQSDESRLSEMRLTELRVSDNGLADMRAVPGTVHPAQGERGAFLKVTVTMDPDDFEAINAEMVRRKRAKERGAQLSGCIREAIRFWRAAGMPRQE